METDFYQKTIISNNFYYKTARSLVRALHEINKTNIFLQHNAGKYDYKL